MTATICDVCKEEISVTSADGAPEAHWFQSARQNQWIDLGYGYTLHLCQPHKDELLKHACSLLTPEQGDTLHDLIFARK